MFSNYNTQNFGYSIKINSVKNKKITNIVISPLITHSPFNIPGCPKYISIENINKINNLFILKKLEHEYDDFLEKKFQILMLLNSIDEIIEIRDVIIRRIYVIKRLQRNKIIINY
jgi:hypothetical protein